jgi:hypothetical protein
MLLKLKSLTAIIIIATFLSGQSAQGGLFDAVDYLSGGNWNTSSASYVDFQENSSPSNNFFEVGDIVYFYQDFSTLGSVTVDGVSPRPAAVYGITALKVQTLTDTSFTDPSFGTTTNRSRIDFTALGTADFTTFLGTTLGIDVSEVTISSTSTFALVSSQTDTSLLSNGSTDFSGFEADLIAGIDGTGFAQGQLGSTVWSYSYYDTNNVNVDPGDPAFNFRYGFNVESTDSSVAVGLTSSVTPYSGSSALVNITTQADTATTSAQNYSGYYGNLSSNLLVGSAVPEPASFAMMSLVGVAALCARRKRRQF